MLYRDIFELKTSSDSIYDITNNVKAVLKASKIKEGTCSIFLSATTAGMMINENNRMLFEDFRNTFNAVAPEKKFYQHPENAFSHIKSSMLSQHLTIPVSNSELILGTWQSILLWEFDTKERERKIIVTINY
ncbi:YjbQ family protein [archaeon]|nr:YjbQ family protein [archaeon]